MKLFLLMFISTLSVSVSKADDWPETWGAEPATLWIYRDCVNESGSYLRLYAHGRQQNSRKAALVSNLTVDIGQANANLSKFFDSKGNLMAEFDLDSTGQPIRGILIEKSGEGKVMYTFDKCLPDGVGGGKF